MAKTKTDWVKASPKDVEKKIIELAKQGITAEKIGLKLRDELGIPKTRLLGIKIKAVLERENLWKNPEIHNIEMKKEKIEKHFEKNKHDYKSQREIVRLVSRLNKLKNQ